MSVKKQQRTHTRGAPVVERFKVLRDRFAKGSNISVFASKTRKPPVINPWVVS
jgi:hypothetical protein